MVNRTADPSAAQRCAGRRPWTKSVRAVSACPGRGGHGVPPLDPCLRLAEVVGRGRAARAASQAAAAALAAAGLDTGNAVEAVLAELPGGAVSHAEGTRAFLAKAAPAARLFLAPLACATEGGGGGGGGGCAGSG